MQKKIIVGNLGADAELKRENGREFVSMSIANTERRKKDDGTYEEKTSWVSATLNGDGGNLLQYLKKGARVYAYGDYSVRMYHSEKQRALVAGVNLYIRDIELISTNVDAVPRDLYDINGAAHRIVKLYWCQDTVSAELYDRNGVAYHVDEKGFVYPPQPVQQDPAKVSESAEQNLPVQTTAANNEQAAQFQDGQPFTDNSNNTAEPLATKPKRNRK